MKREESTSIYSSIEELTVYEETVIVIEPDLQEPVRDELISTIVSKKLFYLNSSFRLQAYQPLQFVMAEETLTGSIERIDENTVFIQPLEEEQSSVMIEMKDIEDILWRGQPFEVD
jgi:hypothetical protein